MIDTNVLFFLEMALFSGVVIAFGVREIIMLSPKNIAKTEAKEAARKAAYAQKEAQSKSSAGHAEG
jgi:hypothetical protein